MKNKEASVLTMFGLLGWFIFAMMAVGIVVLFLAVLSTLGLHL